MVRIQDGPAAEQLVTIDLVLLQRWRHEAYQVTGCHLGYLHPHASWIAKSLPQHAHSQQCQVRRVGPTRIHRLCLTLQSNHHVLVGLRLRPFVFVSIYHPASLDQRTATLGVILCFAGRCVTFAPHARLIPSYNPFDMVRGIHGHSFFF